MIEVFKQVANERIEKLNLYIIYLNNQLQQIEMQKQLFQEELEEYKDFLDQLDE